MVTSERSEPERSEASSKAQADNEDYPKDNRGASGPKEGKKADLERGASSELDTLNLRILGGNHTWRGRCWQMLIDKLPGVSIPSVASVRGHLAWWGG